MAANLISVSRALLFYSHSIPPTHSSVLSSPVQSPTPFVSLPPDSIQISRIIINQCGLQNYNSIPFPVTFRTRNQCLATPNQTKPPTQPTYWSVATSAETHGILRSVYQNVWPVDGSVSDVHAGRRISNQILVVPPHLSLVHIQSLILFLLLLLLQLMMMIVMTTCKQPSA